MLILACSQLDEMKPGGDYLTMEGPQQSPVRYFAKVMLLSSNNTGMVEGYAFMTAHITSLPFALCMLPITSPLHAWHASHSYARSTTCTCACLNKASDALFLYMFSSKLLLQQLKFLVAKRDRSELMCIGGPYIPDDGPEPGANPETLINTAM